MRTLLFFVPLLLCAAPAEQKKSVGHSTVATAPAIKDYKIVGSPMAPITIEVYSDFQCPQCRNLYLETLTPLMTEYVQTGKVRLIHRDFPLPQHQYSRLAARYANAAGSIGKYEVVAAQLFRDQPQWSANGNVEATVATVLSPAEMQKVRAILNDPKAEEGIANDVSLGVKDNLTQTPTMEITHKGTRQPITGNIGYPLLKRYLDQLLAKG